MWSSTVLVAGFAAVAAAATGAGAPVRKLVPPPLRAAAGALKGNGTMTFQQLIDHNNPELGTFSQRIFFNDEFYKGPGSPIILFTPGEIAADGYGGYLTNQTMTGAYAQENGGAVIMMEHRYWGQSSPYSVLDNKNLQYLTLNNSLSDLTYFAKTAKLPFATNGSKPEEAPWVFVGGSYPGAMAAWLEATQPGTFWAYHASSAPVQAVYDMWTYLAPVQEGMPKNCSADITKVLKYMDGVLESYDAQKKTELKTKFGLQDLEHDDDFMSPLMFAVQSWQSNSFTSGYSAFYQLCDSVEGVFNTNGTNSTVPGEEGVGLEKALEGFATYMRTQYVPGYCSTTYPKYYTDAKDVSCLNTHDPNSPLFTDKDVDNQIDRQWVWFLCNEPFAWWQNGPPKDQNPDWQLASRLLTPQWNQDQCKLFFPKEGEYTYGSDPEGKGLSVDAVNAWTHGWNDRKTTRLLYVNGEYDPWKSDSVSSNYRPGGPMQSTDDQPIIMLPKGIHCSDLRLRNAAANAGINEGVQQALGIMKKWIGEFKPSGYPTRKH